MGDGSVNLPGQIGLADRYAEPGMQSLWVKRTGEFGRAFRDSFGPLRSGNFRRYLSGQAVSLVGNYRVNGDGQQKFHKPRELIDIEERTPGRPTEVQSKQPQDTFGRGETLQRPQQADRVAEQQDGAQKAAKVGQVADVEEEEVFWLGLRRWWLAVDS